MKDMDHTRLLQGTPNFPPVALGAWAWGNDNTFGGNYTPQDLKPVFEEAMKRNFILWDTAFVYGMGTSERILGSFLREKQRNSYRISAKFTPQHADRKKENSVEAMFEESCDLLGVSYIDTYWIHNPVGMETWVRQIIPLAKQGKIGEIGLSNFNLAEIKRAQEILAEEGLQAKAIQNHYSIVCRSSETSGILDYCKQNKMTFYAYMVLEQGALTGRFDPEHPFLEGTSRAKNYNKILSRFAQLNQVTGEIAERYRATVAEIMIAWAIAKGTVPIIGVTTISQVEELDNAVKIRLTEHEIGKLEAAADRSGIRTIRMWEKEMLP